MKHQFTTNWTSNGETLTGTVEVTAEAELGFDVTVPANGSLVVNAAIVAAALQSAYILARADVVIKTNSSSAPDDTINLVKNEPVAWIHGANALFTADVTSFHLSNAGATDALVSMRMLVDPTS